MAVLRSHRSLSLPSLAVVLLLAVSLVSTGAAQALSGSSGTTTVTVTPTDNLADLQSVSVHVAANPGQSVYSISARMCTSTAVVVLPSQFIPSKGNCAPDPMSPGASFYQQATAAGDFLTADLAFKVGIGTQTWKKFDNTDVTLTCDNTHPCQLIVGIEVGGGTEFFQAPVTFATAVPPQPPSAPGTPVATAGDASATVTWTAPSQSGGSAIDGYTVTSAPGGATCSWTAGPLTCNVAGLSNGTSYTFTVKAHNSVAGFGPSSLASNSVVPQASGPTGSYFHPLSPVRILDSRTTNGGWNGKLVAGTPRPLQITGANSVPASATAVIMNVTVTGGSANSFVTAFPAGGTVPNASNVNFAVGQTIPNLVTVKLSGSGQVAFANAIGSVDVIADLVGYFDATVADKYNPLPPARILDSRTTNGGWNAPLVAGSPKTLQVRGAGGVPQSADAVVMNITVTGGTANSFVTAYPTGATLPNASNVNFAVGETIPNLAGVKIGTDGKVTFNNAVGSVNVIVDVVGYFDASSGDLFHALSPTRILDSRTATGGWNSKLVAGTPRPLQVTGANGIPAEAHAVIGNTTVTGGSANSFVTVYPAGGSVPNASNVNFAVGQTIPNLTAVKVSASGQVAFNNAVGSVDVIFDAVGYFAAT